MSTPAGRALLKLQKELDAFLDASLLKHSNVLLPRNFSTSHLRTLTPPGITVDKWVAFSYFVVGSICTHVLEGRLKSGYNCSQKWVCLSSKVLRQLGGRAYRDLTNTLVEHGIVECDNTFSVGQCMGYRLGKRYRKQKFRFRTIKDTTVQGILLAHRKKVLKEMKPRILPLAYLTQWLTSGKLEMDKEGAQRYVDALGRSMHLTLDQVATSTKEIWLDNRQYFASRSIERWGEHINLTVDNSGGRLYSPLTSLYEPLRHFLKYDGQELVSFDIRNSQPLHFTLLLRKDFWKEGSRRKWSLEKLDRDLWESVRKTSEEDEETTPSITLHRGTHFTGKQRFTKGHFASLVFTGELYDFLSETLRGKFPTKKGKDRFESRASAKREVLKLMYFDPTKEHSPSQDVFRAFATLFPEEARIMQTLKKRSYKDFPVLLQRLEAQILLHHVCRLVYNHDSSIPLFTIHDSLVTTAEHAEFIQQTLLREYEKALGAPPALERKELSPTAAYRELPNYIAQKLSKDAPFLTEGIEVKVETESYYQGLAYTMGANSCGGAVDVCAREKEGTRFCRNFDLELQEEFLVAA